jgi:hypothetical protein
MTNSDDVQRTILRNMLLGRWAAEKLGLTGREPDANSERSFRRCCSGDARAQPHVAMRSAAHTSSTTGMDITVMET